MNGRLLLLTGCLVALVGCSASRAQLNQALLAFDPAAPAAEAEAGYLIRCPDVLEIRAEGRPECQGLFEVGPDGRVPVATSRVAGLTASAASAVIARELHVGAVSVRVAEHRSQHLYLVGAIASEHQVVAYRGPETVVDLLRRVGLNQGASLGEVRVVRGHVADGKPPEVFHVDLEAVLIRRDPQTNVRLEPSDHVHITQRRSSRIAERLPPWLRPVYETLSGVREGPIRSSAASNASR
jgi:protein involved in polysaccharide export with SLBB domain